MSPLLQAFVSFLLALVLIGVPAGDARAQTGGDLDAIRKRLAAANAETSRVLGDLKSLDSRIFGVGRSIVRDEQQSARIKSEIRSTQNRIADLQARMASVRKSSNARARQMYKNGPATVLAVVFTAQTLGDLPRLGMFFESLAKKDGTTLAESTRLKADLAQQRSSLAAVVEKLAVRVQRSDAEKVNLVSARNQRAASLVKLKEAIQNAIAAEKAVLAARAAAVRTPQVGRCSAGSQAADQRLSALLDWYAPASGGAGFVPPRLDPTGVVTTGGATYYGPGFDGCRSASGATFKAGQMTAASLSFPMGTLLKVTLGGKATVVVITDRGPYSSGPVLDLSAGAASSIGLSGSAQVRMEILLPKEPAPAFP